MQRSLKMTFCFLPKLERKEMRYQPTAKQMSDSNKARLTGKVECKHSSPPREEEKDHITSLWVPNPRMA